MVGVLVHLLAMLECAWWASAGGSLFCVSCPFIWDDSCIACEVQLLHAHSECASEWQSAFSGWLGVELWVAWLRVLVRGVLCVVVLQMVSGEYSLRPCGRGVFALRDPLQSEAVAGVFVELCGCYEGQA